MFKNFSNATEMQSDKTTVPKSSKSMANPYSLQKKVTMRCSSNVDAKIEFSPKDFVEPQILLVNNDIAFDDESKKIYTNALKYINKFHEFMNTKLSEQNCQYGDAYSSNENEFKFPEIPNYTVVFFKLLNKSQYMNVNTSIKNSNQVPTNIISENRIIDNQKHTKSILKHNLGITNTLASLPIRHYFTEQDEGLRKENQTTTKIYIDHVLNEDICIENNIDKDKKLGHRVIQGQRYVQKPEVLNHFSKECGNINDSSISVAENKCNKSNNDLVMNLVKERVLEEFFCTFNKTNDIVDTKKEEKEAKLVQSCFNIVNIQPQTNMLDYARQKMERQNKTTMESLTTVKNLLETEQNKEQGNHINNNQLRPTTPKKVRNMFEKISRTKQSDKIIDSKVLSRIISDSDSDIMNDEEFERTKQNSPRIINGKNVLFKKKREEKEQKKYDSGKSHPLKLTGKDLSKLNQKMLNTIGIFTDRGDIRPGIINILEEQSRAKSNDDRNKQFRSKRKWDIQIHLKPKNERTESLTSLSSINTLSVQSIDMGDDIDRIQQVKR